MNYIITIYLVVLISVVGLGIQAYIFYNLLKLGNKFTYNYWPVVIFMFWISLSLDYIFFLQ